MSSRVSGHRKSGVWVFCLGMICCQAHWVIRNHRRESALDPKLCRNFPPCLDALNQAFKRFNKWLSVSYVNSEDHRFSRACFVFSLGFNACALCAMFRVVESMRCWELMRRFYLFSGWSEMQNMQSCELTHTLSDFQLQDWNSCSFPSFFHQFASIGQVLNTLSAKGWAWLFLCSFAPLHFTFRKAAFS